MTTVIPSKAKVSDETGVGGACHSFGHHSDLFIKRPRSSCVKEFCGWETETKYRVATLEEPENDIMYAVEHTSCCVRFCCGPRRTFEVNTWLLGKDEDGSIIANYKRPCRLPLFPCKCCCHQEIVARNLSGAKLGTVRESFWLCVPTFDFLDGLGQSKYSLRCPTCCGGCCVNCCDKSCCNFHFPFYVFSKPNLDHRPVGKIVKNWEGVRGTDRIELEYPRDADAADKVTFFGASLLLYALFYE